MTTNALGEGRTMNVTLGGTVAVGTVFEGAGMIGVHLNGGVSGEVDAVAIDGVFRLAKETPLVIAQGDYVYWDAVNDNIDKTTTNIPAGIAVAAAASGATTVDVKINAGSAPA